MRREPERYRHPQDRRGPKEEEGGRTGFDNKDRDKKSVD